MLWSRNVKGRDKTAAFAPFKNCAPNTQSKGSQSRTGILTEGNGSSSSLVKELKGYDEEGIRSAQHGFKGQELLE